MDSKIGRARGIVLEAAYLRQIEAAQQRYHGELCSRAGLRLGLASELGIDEQDPLLDQLVELGITSDTAPAFEALPLLDVAWADGDVAAEERWRVLGIATGFGLELGRPAHAQLEIWLTRPPPQALFEAWYRFARRLLARPEGEARVRRVLDGVKEVAAAAGGVFGFGAVSGSERSAIDRVRSAVWSG